MQLSVSLSLPVTQSGCAPESNHMTCCSPVLYLQTSELRFELQNLLY